VKVYFDTNVLISAFTARGLCADLMRVVLAEHELVTGEVNLRELDRVLVEKFHAPKSVAASVVSQLRDHTVIPVPDAPASIPVRDPDDAWVLASVLASGADMLVTGDQDLLVIAASVPVPILTPRLAWEQLRGDRDRVV
jgi:putative PIN family toxin of toxin-antitoxin system